MTDQTPPQSPVRPMHPFVALAAGVAFLAGMGTLLFALLTLLRLIPAEDAGAAYEATLWGVVGLLVSGLAGARMTGGGNPLQRLAAAVGSLASLVRRR